MRTRDGEVPATIVWLLAWGVGIGGLIVAVVHLLDGRYVDALGEAGIGVLAWSVLLTLYTIWARDRDDEGSHGVSTTEDEGSDS